MQKSVFATIISKPAVRNNLYLVCMFRRIILGLLGAWMGVTAQAQKISELIVFDGYSGRPVENAWLIGHEIDSLFTNPNGYVADVDLGQSTFIIIGKQGYQSDTLRPQEKGMYRVYLYPNARRLSEVSIISETPGGNKLMTPLYGHRISFNKPFAFDGLQMAIAINTIPGVQWEQRGLGGSTRISVRGSGWRSNFGIRGTRVYFDQIPLSQPDGFGLPELIDPYFFESFEMFKGSAGSAYGGYSGGSLILKSAYPTEYGLTFNLGLTGGSNRLMRAQMGASYTSRTFSVAAGGMSMVHKGYREQEYVNRKLYTAKADWHLHVNHHISFRMFYGLANWGLPGDLTMAEAESDRRMANPFSLQAQAKLDKEFVRGGLTYTVKYGEHFMSELTVFGNWADKYNPYGTTPAFSGIKKEIFGGGGFREVLRLRYGKKIVWHGNMGFEYEGEQVKGREFQNLSGIEGAQKLQYTLQSHLFFAFAQSSVDLPKRFKLDFGLVGAINGMNKKELVPDSSVGSVRVMAQPGAYPYLGLTKVFKDLYSVYIRYNNGYTTPTMTELLSDDGTFNTGLKNETVHQLELGTRGQIGTSKFSWGLGGFVHFYRNYIVPYYPTPTSPVRFMNAGSARHIGAEAELDWYAYDNNSWKAGVKQVWLGLRYAFIDPRFTKFTDAGTDYSGQIIPGTPAHKISLLYNMKLRYGFALNLDLSARDRVLLNFANDASVPLLFKGNMRVSWQGTLFSVLFPELFFGINNFTDAKDYSFYRVNAPGGRYLNPDQGIFFYGGVNFKTASFFKEKKKG